MKEVFFLLCLLLGGCWGPPPPVPPGPLPADVFAGRVFDCRSDVVKIERDAVMPPVIRCLRSVEPSKCLVARASEYNPASVACVARDVGADANAAVLAGSKDPADEVVADAARDFIRSHALGYK